MGAVFAVHDAVSTALRVTETMAGLTAGPDGRAYARFPGRVDDRSAVLF
ncbi:MAG: hypothetical protein ACRDVZ_11845 [Jiangellaceae bacterium]